tara:strand:- start:188 stop:505 length:318 start_codon:yes stop_codon:yes gene_type:complete
MNPVHLQLLIFVYPACKKTAASIATSIINFCAVIWVPNIDAINNLTLILYPQWLLSPLLSWGSHFQHRLDLFTDLIPAREARQLNIFVHTKVYFLFHHGLLPEQV